MGLQVRSTGKVKSNSVIFACLCRLLESFLKKLRKVVELLQHVLVVSLELLKYSREAQSEHCDDEKRNAYCLMD